MKDLPYLRSEAQATYRVDPRRGRSRRDDAGMIILFMEILSTGIGRCIAAAGASNHDQLADADLGMFQGLGRQAINALGLVDMMGFHRRILSLPGCNATLMGGH